MPGNFAKFWGHGFLWRHVAIEGNCSVEYMIKLNKLSVLSTLVAAWLAFFIATGGTAMAADYDNTAPIAEVQADEDPLEDFNRFMFEIHQFFDVLLLTPAAEFYNKVLPPVIQTGVRNFLHNLRGPVIFANDLFQGEGDRALLTAQRFLINTTVGVGGLKDMAGEWGYYYHNEDFGQTAATWGIGSGPYLVLPIIGPVTPRDGIGRVIEYFVDPFNIWADNRNHDEWVTARTIASAAAAKASVQELLDEKQRTSLDFYATMRTLYLQRRADEIRNGTAPKKGPSPGITYNLNTSSPGDDADATLDMNEDGAASPKEK